MIRGSVKGLCQTRCQYHTYALHVPATRSLLFLRSLCQRAPTHLHEPLHTGLHSSVHALACHRLGILRQPTPTPPAVQKQHLCMHAGQGAAHQARRTPTAMIIMRQDHATMIFTALRHAVHPKRQADNACLSSRADPDAKPRIASRIRASP